MKITNVENNMRNKQHKSKDMMVMMMVLIMKMKWKLVGYIRSKE